MSIKASLLKWAHHLNKGTTWGYASTKDCLVVTVFSYSLLIILGFLFVTFGNVVGVQKPVLDKYTDYFYYVGLLTIIADYSLVIMRINDISGRRYFTRKRSVFRFIVSLLLLDFFLGIFIGIMSKIYDIPTDLTFTIFGIRTPISFSFSLLIFIIIYIYPTSSKEREEMPIVEYKLPPTEFIILLFFIIISAFVFLLYKATTESKVEVVTEAEDGTIIDDRDEKEYKTVKIGKQTWMAENLNYSNAGRIGKCYGEGGRVIVDFDAAHNPIYKTLSNAEIQANCQKYGRLYDWETAKEICPEGWHLPSNDEWNALYEHIGGEDYSTPEVQSKLKAKIGWTKEGGNSNNGTDDYEFAALPGGLCYCVLIYDKITGNKIIDCVDHTFGLLGSKGSWWTATENEYNTSEPESWAIDCCSIKISKMSLMSVRCVRD